MHASSLIQSQPLNPLPIPLDELKRNKDEYSFTEISISECRGNTGEIWEYNILDKIVITKIFESTKDCISTNSQGTTFLPILKTDKGCIGEFFNRDCFHSQKCKHLKTCQKCGSTRERTCNEKVNCPLLKDKIYFESQELYKPYPTRSPNDRWDFDPVGADDDEDEDFDEDFDEGFNQKVRYKLSNKPIENIEVFISRCCRVRRNERDLDRGSVTNSDLKAKYKEWCLNVGRVELSPKTFKKIMNSLGFIQNNDPERSWKNLSLSH